MTFTGTSIDWTTTKGKAYGKASVKIDGVSRAPSTCTSRPRRGSPSSAFAGCPRVPHTMVIQVLGQKNASATSNKVVVDGFIVHA